MPIARFQMPDGRVARFEVPEGTTPEQAQSMMEQHFAAEKPAAKPTTTAAQMFQDELATSLPGGVVRGVKDVIDTGAGLLAKGYDKLTGADEGARVKAMNDAGKADFAAAQQRVGAGGSDVARVGGQILATAPVGGVLASPLTKVAPGLSSSIASAGMRGPNMATRIVGGAITGGASAGLVDPDFATTGAVIGGALPPALKAAGAVGAAAGRVIRGPEVPESVRQGVQAARAAGYVVPPTQASPTLANRLMEGFAGKVTTAQNASARNQPLTNALAKAAIGADDLTPEALQAVRSKANAAYSQLGAVGAFQADDAFKTAIKGAGGSKALPGIANKEVDDLIEALSGQGALDAQQTIESIKRLRFEGSGNKAAQDPTKRALGSAQMKIAGALEDLIDRNLSGSPELLANYRAARQTLAKVYDVEKAMNPASGNVDARKLAKLLEKGRPLTGELKTIAQFGGQFKTAAQVPEGMGSLPQSSPLDWTAATGMSLATSNPLMMAGVLARPAARKAALSNTVQNALVKAPSADANALARLLSDPELQQLVYRAAPVAAAR